MATERDDDRWGNEDPEARLDPTTLRLAKEKVNLPAKLLIAASIFMLLFGLVNIGVAFSGYDLQLKMLEFIEQQQPPGKQRDDLKKQVDEARNRDRTVEYVQSGVFGALGLTLDVFILIGGLRMQSLRGRTLAMVGAICAIIPANSCCCIGMPIGMPLGIWALMVLTNADVKAAFEASKRLGR